MLLRTSWFCFAVLALVVVSARAATAGSITCLVSNGELARIIAEAPPEAQIVFLRVICIDAATFSSSGAGEERSRSGTFGPLTRSKKFTGGAASGSLQSFHALNSHVSHSTGWASAVPRQLFGASDPLSAYLAGITTVGSTDGSPAVVSILPVSVARTSTSSAGGPDFEANPGAGPLAAPNATTNVSQIEATALADQLFNANGAGPAAAVGTPLSNGGASVTAAQATAETAQVVPEPGSLTLLGVGLLVLAARLKRRKF